MRRDEQVTQLETLIDNEPALGLQRGELMLTAEVLTLSPVLAASQWATRAEDPAIRPRSSACSRGSLHHYHGTYRAELGMEQLSLLDRVGRP